MAYDLADWSITRSTGVIDYIGDDHVRFGGATPSYASVIEAHQAWQALADDETSTGNDELAIADLNPSQRSTDQIVTLINGYTITDAGIEHLYDGSITQQSDGTRWDGFVNFGASDVTLQIIQNGAVLTDDFWNTNTDPGGINADTGAGISHRFLLKTINAGTPIDGTRLIGLTRQWGRTYSEFRINSTSPGLNVFAVTDATDGNNTTLEATVATYDQFTNTEGYNLLDVNNDTTDEPYYSAWTWGAGTIPASPGINDFYEYAKWLTRDGTASTLYGLDGLLFRGITHEINVDTPTGTFVEPESVSWASGTGQLLATDSTTAPTKLWIQLLTGVAPTDGQTITGNGGATADVNVTVTARPVSAPFVGTSTGTAINPGAYGVGIVPTNLTQNDALVALDAVTYQPPNFVTFSVGGLVIGEDRVLVGPWSGTTDPNGDPAFDLDQLTLNTSLLGATETAVVVTAAIPGDTPNTGWIRIQLDSGEYWYQPYTSWSGSTFTIPSSDYSVATGNGGATAPRNVFIAYIDKLATATTESFTGVYSGDRDLVVLVRDGGGTPIKQYIATSTLGSGGGSSTAIRTSDA